MVMDTGKKCGKKVETIFNTGKNVNFSEVNLCSPYGNVYEAVSKQQK